jgi:lysozyme
VAELLGLDCSNHQAAVDWAAVAASGRRFAFLKASEDPDYVDRWFAGPLGHNWAATRAAGLTRGAYTFARPSVSTAAASVGLLEQRIIAAGGLAAGDLIALDIEDERVPDGENLSGWVLDWLERAEAALGVRPVVYSGLWYMQPHGLCIPEIGAYPLWFASYQPLVPPVPPGWQRLDFWQFTAHGSVPGVAGDCDENRFFGTETELAAIGYGGTSAPAPYDVDAARDRLWHEAEMLEANGWPWLGQGVKSLVALSKGDQ